MIPTVEVPLTCDLMPTTSRKITRDGYLEAPARLSRTGLQKYRAREVCGMDGMPVFKDRGPDDFVFLFRPPEEVLDPESIASFENLPVTNGHPDPARYPNGVTADNWKELSIGHVRDCVPGKDKYVHGTVYVYDAKAVREVFSGKSQLSLGYRHIVELRSGITPDGEKFDGVMTMIRGNHLATVYAARAGEECRVADHQTSEETMPALVKVTVDGLDHELPEGNAAALVKSLVAQRDEARTELKTKVDAHGAAVAKLTEDHNAEIAALRSSTVPRADVAALVVEHSELLKVAGELCDGLIVEKLDTPALRRAVVAHLCEKRAPVKSVVAAVLAGTALDKATDEQVRVACNTAIASAYASTMDESTRRDRIADAFARSGDSEIDGKKKTPTQSSDEVPDYSDEAYRRKMSNQGQRTAGK